MKKVMIAVGDQNYIDILKDIFNNHRDQFTLCNDVLHRDYLEELVNEENPDILIIHDYYLPSKFKTNIERDKEIIRIIRNLQYTNDHLRIVFLCERPKGDALLSTLVSLGVRDIFNQRAFDIDQFVQQLIEKPHFSNVDQFLITDYTYPNNPDLLKKQENTNDKENQEEQQENVSSKEEKKDIPKKDIIKREYSINITNKSEKIVGIPLEKKIIFVASPFSRTGCTFISHLLAREISKLGVSVTYIENPFSHSYSFERFKQHFSENYRSKFFTFVSERKPHDFVFNWSIEGINFVVKHPKEESLYHADEISFEQYLKLILSSDSVVSILDVGSDWNLKIYQDLFEISSLAYFVVDPDISNMNYLLYSDNEYPSSFREIILSNKSFLIGNRFNSKVSKKIHINDAYQNKFKTFIPEFSVTDILDAQSEGKFLNDFSLYNNVISKSLNPLIQDILPKDFLQRHKKHNGLFKKIFNNTVSFQRKN